LPCGRAVVEIAGGGTRLTVRDADLVESLADLAVTVALVGFVTLAGAV